MDRSPMQLLAAEAGRLTDRLAGATPGWFAARVTGGPGTRAALLGQLVATLADLGAAADNGAPPGVRPAAVGAHALADQVTVLVGELLVAPGAADLSARAAAEVGACYDALWPPEGWLRKAVR